MTVFETECYQVFERGDRLVGREKPSRVLNENARVFVAAIEGDTRTAVKNALGVIEVEKIFSPGDRVAVKVNLGGGITGIPSSFTEPEIVAGVIGSLQELGAHPFICEANMRTLTIDRAMLRRRGYLKLLFEFNVDFVNLSDGETVEFFLSDLDRPLLLPRILLDPAVKIVSVPTPKHHWECGVTLSQKNMYGAIAERRKSRYHFHGQSLLDRVVAGSARIMKPDLVVIGATQMCGGLGPHLCVPLDFYRVIISNDMLAGDAVAADFLGFPYDRAAHAMINLGRDELRYELIEGSVGLAETTRAKIDRHKVKPHQTGVWRWALLWTYYLPHWLQYAVIGRLEFMATWINKLFYAPRGDPPPKSSTGG